MTDWLRAASIVILPVGIDEQRCDIMFYEQAGTHSWTDRPNPDTSTLSDT